MSDDCEPDDEWQPAPSDEVVDEGLRRLARKADDRDLDEMLAVATARRDVNAAHGMHAVAELWQRSVLAYDDVRRQRRRDRRDFDDIINPAEVRPMTPEELAEVEWHDKPQEPPC